MPLCAQTALRKPSGTSSAAAPRMLREHAFAEPRASATTCTRTESPATAPRTRSVRIASRPAPVAWRAPAMSTGTPIHGRLRGITAPNTSSAAASTTWPPQPSVSLQSRRSALVILAHGQRQDAATGMVLASRVTSGWSCRSRNPADAVRVAHLPPARHAGQAEDLKVLSDYRDELVAQRTAEANRLHADLAIVCPGYARHCRALGSAHALHTAAQLLERARTGSMRAARAAPDPTAAATRRAARRVRYPAH